MGEETEVNLKSNKSVKIDTQDIYGSRSWRRNSNASA